MPKKEITNVYGTLEVKRSIWGRKQIHFRRTMTVHDESQTLVPNEIVLNRREFEVVQLSSHGISCAETARILGIKESTVKNIRFNAAERNQDLNPSRRIDFDALVIAAYGVGITAKEVQEALENI